MRKTALYDVEAVEKSQSLLRKHAAGYGIRSPWADALEPIVPELPEGDVYQSRPDGSLCLLRDGRRYSISRSGDLYADYSIPQDVALYLIARWQEVQDGE